MTILFDGIIFIIGMNGNEFGWKEWPTHFTTHDIGGKTSVFYTFSFTFA